MKIGYNWQKTIKKTISILVFTGNAVNILFCTPDVTKLPHYNYSESHILWSHVQLAKTSTSRNRTVVNINGKNGYWMWRCKGEKQCQECEQVVPNCFVNNNRKGHPKSELRSIRDCPDEFVCLPSIIRRSEKVD